jgi:cytidylate kinase
VVDFSEERYPVRSFIDKMLRAGTRTVARVSSWQEDNTGEKTLTLRELDAAACAKLVQTSVLVAYQAGNIVIVGRGGQAILRDKPGALHIRVIAPLEKRMQRLRDQGVRGVSDIKTTIEQQDRASAEYLKRFHNIQWDDPTLYDLVINTGRLEIDTAVQMVVGTVQKMYAPTA